MNSDNKWGVGDDGWICWGNWDGFEGRVKKSEKGADEVEEKREEESGVEAKVEDWKFPCLEFLR